MTQIVIRSASEDDFAHIVALNESEVQQTSPMSLEGLRQLARLSSYHKVAVAEGQVAAFLLAMRESAAYPSDNHAWFAARFSRFMYVDRIVVGASFARMKIGTLLYEDLFRHARSQGIRTVTCEYNIEPPNPASRRFHDKLGFKELGTQWGAQGTKRVSLQAAEI